MLKFTVPGQPQGKGRARVTRGGKHTYTPPKTKEYQSLVETMAWNAAKEYWCEEPLKATIECYYQIPKSMPKYKRKLVEDGKLYPMVKPDLDNVAKAILDALNSIIYKDDKQVVELIVTKHYSDTPRVDVTIEVIE
jgi:Holliday junction resolvase RusA-like endonuclease